MAECDLQGPVPGRCAYAFPLPFAISQFPIPNSHLKIPATAAIYIEPMPTLSTLAIQANRVDSMAAFYPQAFGFQFRNVDVHGLPCRFGERNGLELKLVPIRSSPDFDSFPIHQLGIEVDRIADVIALAERLGGRVQDPPIRDGDRLHAGPAVGYHSARLIESVRGLVGVR